MTIPVLQGTGVFVSAGEDLDPFWRELRFRPDLPPRHGPVVGPWQRNGCGGCLSGSYYEGFIRQYWNYPRCD